MTETISASAADRAARIMRRADELAAFTATSGEITRLYGTPEFRAALDLVTSWMEAAGMSVTIDQVGNLRGRYDADPAVPHPRSFAIGGHLDSVRDAGRYDGVLGVLTGIAFVEGLAARQRRLPFHVEVIACADEEGGRFVSYLGSRSLAGSLDPETLQMRDDAGITLADAIREFGGDPDRLAENRLDPGSLLGFVEVHIEQGPVLEQRGLPVGVVSAISGAIRASISIEGVAGHAGTVPMPMRRDALTGAAEFILAVERLAGEVDGMVGTVGQAAVGPGASNVIPGRVDLTVDLRHPNERLREEVARRLQDALAEIGERRQLATHWQDAHGYPTVECDIDFVSRLLDAIADEGYEAIQLASGAGHDAVPISEITPVAMLFVRCKGGISHNPAESITADDVEVAIRVLDRFLLTIATAVAASFQLDE